MTRNDKICCNWKELILFCVFFRGWLVVLGGVVCAVVVVMLAWCGVVWCGVVWCGVGWCGVVWCGVVWCGVVWCGVVWCGVVWCGVVWCGGGGGGGGEYICTGLVACFGPVLGMNRAQRCDGLKRYQSEGGQGCLIVHITCGHFDTSMCHTSRNPPNLSCFRSGAWGSRLALSGLK